MPWHKVKSHGDCPSSRPIAVVKDSDGSVAGCHASETSADRQLAALYASEGKSTIVLHNRPGDHAGKLHGAAAFDAVPQMSDRNIAYGYMENSNVINSTCRTGNKHEKSIGGQIGTLDSEFAATQPLRESIVVYRGVGDHSLNDAAVGSSWTDRAYTSTSVHREIAESYGGTVVQMKIPQGRRALQVDPTVGELLLPRNSTFQVTGKQAGAIKVEVI